MTHPLTRHLSRMLGEDAGVGQAPINGVTGLFPQELADIARAVPDRQAEFAAGRRAARIALSRIGRPAQAIPIGPRRAPQWPEDVVGTITHDNGLALAAACDAAAVLGVGIDLTEAVPLPGRTRAEILPLESEAGFDDLTARAGFSAKESLFKALFPCIGDYFGFSSARVAPDLAAGTFQVELTKDLGPFKARSAWQGALVREGDMLLSALLINR